MVVVTLGLIVEAGQVMLTQKFNIIIIIYILLVVAIQPTHGYSDITMEIKFILKVMAQSGLLMIRVQI